MTSSADLSYMERPRRRPAQLHRRHRVGIRARWRGGVFDGEVYPIPFGPTSAGALVSASCRIGGPGEAVTFATVGRRGSRL